MKPVILVLPYPISANRYWQTRVMNAKTARGKAMATTHLSTEAKAYKKQVQALALAAGVRTPLNTRTQIDVRLYPARPLDWQARQRKLGPTWDDGVRSIDLDNANKVLLDALKGVVIVDDNWQVRRIVSERMEPDEHGPRVVVRVMALAAEQPQLELAEVRDA